MPSDRIYLFILWFLKTMLTILVLTWLTRRLECCSPDLALYDNRWKEFCTTSDNNNWRVWSTLPCQCWILNVHFCVAELHRYGGGLVETDGKDPSSAAADSKQGGASSKAHTDVIVASNISVPHSDIYHMGVPAQRAAVVSQRQGQRPLQKWKGPDKISKIYGDWIDDIE